MLKNIVMRYQTDKLLIHNKIHTIKIDPTANASLLPI